ncbi:hypothetical protein D9M73_108220 [compost metagenome]
MGVLAQLGGFGRGVTREARQDRLALGRADAAALRHHQRVGDRLGQVGEQLAHVLGGLHPRIGRGARPVFAGDIGRIGDAQQRIVRLAEILRGEAARVGRDQRQIAVIGEIEQRRFGLAFDLVEPPGQLDIEPVGEQRLQAIGISQRALRLILGEQPRQAAFAPGGEREQAVGMPLQRREIDMRREFQRPIKMRARHQYAQVAIAILILRIEREPVDHRCGGVRHVGAAHAQHRADHRLHPRRARGIAKRHRCVQAIAVGQGGGGKAQFLRALGNRLGLDRAVEHGVGREDPKGYERGMGHSGW